MVQGYTSQLKALLLEQGCRLLRTGKGDHEIWTSPHSGRSFVVDSKIMSRHTANAVLKQAGIKRKL